MEQTMPAQCRTMILSVMIETLTRLWKPCRLIGLINKIFCYLIMIVLVVNTMIILTHCDYCRSVLCQNICTEAEKKPWIVLITIWTFCLFMVQLINVNNYLRSTYMDLESVVFAYTSAMYRPFDGTYVKVWLHHHKVIFQIFIISITPMYLQNFISKFDIFCIIFLIIGLFKELLVVEKYNEALRTFHLIRQFIDHS